MQVKLYFQKVKSTRTRVMEATKCKPYLSLKDQEGKTLQTFCSSLHNLYGNQILRVGGFHVTSSPPCWWTVKNRSLISAFCFSTRICSFHYCYLCLPRLHENHLLWYPWLAANLHPNHRPLEIPFKSLGNKQNSPQTLTKHGINIKKIHHTNLTEHAALLHRYFTL